MADHWEFFPCSMGDNQAFIFTNIDIRKRLEKDVPEKLLKVLLKYNHTYENGLPTNDEFEVVSTIEDEIQNYADSRGDHYVGRITVAGQRHFFFYVQEWDGYQEAVAEIGEKHGYQLKFATKDDPGHSQYFDYLWPTDSDWQIIKDMRVLEALKKRGDDHSVERDVDHWAYFYEIGDAEQYTAWAIEFGLEETYPIEFFEGKYAVRLKHRGTMLLDDISSKTIALNLKATEMNGKYDGWETPIMIPKAD